MPQPTPFLPGRRIGLHVLEPEDAPQMLAWFNDPEIRQFLKFTLPMSLTAEREWIEGLGKRREHDLVFGLVTTEDKRLIGNMGLHRIDWRNRLATTGSVIGAKECWSQGYGFEAKMILLEYAFNSLGLRKIESSVYSTNPRSRRCLEKCGYREEGVRKAAILKRGEYIDVTLMAVFREEWLPLWDKFKEAA
jgi:RimJ/RimL family protein N-acetyltransferase